MHLVQDQNLLQGMKISWVTAFKTIYTIISFLRRFSASISSLLPTQDFLKEKETIRKKTLR